MSLKIGNPNSVREAYFMLPACKALDQRMIYFLEIAPFRFHKLLHDWNNSPSRSTIFMKLLKMIMKSKLEINLMEFRAVFIFIINVFYNIKMHMGKDLTAANGLHLLFSLDLTWDSQIILRVLINTIKVWLLHHSYLFL